MSAPDETIIRTARKVHECCSLGHADGCTGWITKGEQYVERRAAGSPPYKAGKRYSMACATTLGFMDEEFTDEGFLKESPSSEATPSEELATLLANPPEQVAPPAEWEEWASALIRNEALRIAAGDALAGRALEFAQAAAALAMSKRMA